MSGFSFDPTWVRASPEKLAEARGAVAALGVMLVALISAVAAPTHAFAQAFQSQGPGPSAGPSGTIQSADAPPNGTVVGAIQAIVPDPVNANTLYITTPNGGIWKTINGGARWTSSTENLGTLSISSLAMDPTDGTRQTLIAGAGLTSNGRAPFVGNSFANWDLISSTDGGTSWTPLAGSSIFKGQTVADVAERGQTILAATYELQEPGTVGGLFRSTNGGTGFTLVSGTGGLPLGPVSSLVADPANSTNPAINGTFYAAVTAPTANAAGFLSTSIWRSTDNGANWTQIFNSANSGGTITNAAQTVIRLAAGPGNTLAAGVLNFATCAPAPCTRPGTLTGLFYSNNANAASPTWAALPAAQLPVINNGQQAAPNFAIAIDPNHTNLVYVSGDRIAADPFTVTAFRADFTALNSTSLTDGNTSDGSTVHADSRGLAFDANGRLLLSSDGGIYARTNPQNNSGQWVGLNGNLSLFESYAVAYDANSHRLATASQDTGVALQSAPGSAAFNAINGADGINVVINDRTLAGRSAIYSSVQCLNNPSETGCNNTPSINRLIIDAAGNVVGPVGPTPNPAGPTITFNVPVNNVSFSSPIALNRIDPRGIAVGGSDLYVTQDPLTGGAGATPNQNAINLTLKDVGTTTVGTTTGVISKIAYGTNDDPNAIVAGANTGIWLSTTAAANSLNKLANYIGGTPVSIVFDSRSQDRIFAADGSKFFGTTNATTTATFTNLTGFLPGSLFAPNTLEFISTNGVNALLVGGVNNVENAQSTIAVADSDNSGNLTGWRYFGRELPNTFIGNMVYNPTADVLAVGTFGRGAWVLYDVTSYFPQASVLQFGLANNDSLPDASFLTNGTVGNRPLIKYGTGTLTIAGTATYSGPTTMNAGAMVVTGDITSSSGLTVQSGTVFGTGALPATTVNPGATLTPGLPGTPGTLTVQGNLVVASGSIYSVQAAPTTFSKANVNGTATLSGGALVAFGNGVYHAGTYSILAATGGVGGTFSSLATLGSMIGVGNPYLTYGLNDAFLVLDPRVALVGRESRNQSAVGNAINNALNNGAVVPAAFNTLLGLSGPALSNALDQVSGQSVGGFTQAATQLTMSFLSLLLNPFAGAPGGNGGVIGYAREFGAGPVSPEVAAAYAAVTPRDLRPGTFDRHWSIWAQGYGGYNKTSGNVIAGTADTNVTTYGVVTGFDYRATPDLLLGFALGGGGTNWGLAQGLGGGRSDAFQIGLYGTKQFGAAYLAGALSYAWHDVTTDRTVAVAGTDKLEAKFQAQNFAGRVESGYRFDMPVIAVTPYAAFQAQNTRTPAYSETAVSGSNTFALSFNSRSSTATRVELGSWLDRLVALSNGDAIAWRGRAAWAHDNAGAQGLNAAFQTLPGENFTVNGAAPPTNLALLTSGVEYRMANGISFGAKFDTELAAKSQTYAGTGTVRYTW